jgi:SOS regulatory protein LexA
MSFDQYKNKIVSFYREHKRAPGYQEIMSMLGFKSKNAVYKLINKLVDEGIFEKDSRGKLIPMALHGEVPMLGLVEAGIPTDVEAGTLDSISIDEFLIKQDSTTYMLRVKGESMIEAHIADGDMVLVEKREHAKVGDMVIADVDGGWTLKYYKIDKKGRPYLEPANKHFKNIYPEQYMRVAAVVKAVIRKFN